jgi:hypothetical protein
MLTSAGWESGFGAGPLLATAGAEAEPEAGTDDAVVLALAAELEAAGALDAAADEAGAALLAGALEAGAALDGADAGDAGAELAAGAGLAGADSPQAARSAVNTPAAATEPLVMRKRRRETAEDTLVTPDRGLRIGRPSPSLKGLPGRRQRRHARVPRLNQAKAT